MDLTRASLSVRFYGNKIQVSCQVVLLLLNLEVKVTRRAGFLFIFSGGCSCSESSLRYLLNSEPSKGIIVVPGGAAEIRYAMQGSLYTIIASKRKGFVRLALTTGFVVTLPHLITSRPTYTA